MMPLFLVICIEVLLFFTFPLITCFFNSSKGKGETKYKFSFTRSWVKGIIERSFIVFMLFAGFQGAAIILFGAIKIGTRVDQDKEDKVSNDYFLIGNLVSITAAVSVYLLLKNGAPF